MSNLEQFKIDLHGLAEGNNIFDFDLDDSYFEAIEAQTVRSGHLHTTLNVHRVEGLFDMDFHTEGSVMVVCDLCLEEMEQPISTDNHLVAKFGEKSSEDDELVMVREDEGILDVAWLVYEFIELGIPLRHVHAPGKCNPAMMKILEEHSAARSGAGDVQEAMDSRWAALLKLKE